MYLNPPIHGSAHVIRGFFSTRRISPTPTSATTRLYIITKFHIMTWTPPSMDLLMSFVDFSPRDGYKAPTNTCTHSWKTFLSLAGIQLSMDAKDPWTACNIFTNLRLKNLSTTNMENEGIGPTLPIIEHIWWCKCWCTRLVREGKYC